MCCAREALTREIRRARLAMGGSAREGTEGAQAVGRAMAAQVTEAQLTASEATSGIVKLGR